MKSGRKSERNSQVSLPTKQEDTYRSRLEKLCECDRIISKSEILDFGDISKLRDDSEDAVLDRDGCDKDYEEEFRRLTKLLDVSSDTHSLTKIEINLPPCLKYTFRSGRTHLNSSQFSPLTRGYQGPAIAVSAIATSHLIEPHCWNEPVIDRVVEDGDTYYSDSYAGIVTDDRRTLTILDLKRHLDVRKTHRIFVKIDDPMYVGTFRSETPKDLHVAKALDQFFKKHKAALLTSPALNIAIWKGSKFFNIFDAQPRLDSCKIAESGEDGSAKLFLVHDLKGVLFFILEKSNVQNEPFVLYNVTISDARKLSSLSDDKEATLGEPRRRPSGYKIHETFRAAVSGSYHLLHPALPKEFHGNGHLTISVTAIVYSKLLSASKWTKVMVDLIFNQSNIYLTDLVRVLNKTLDEQFSLSVSDLLCDVFLGVYTAKIKVEENVIPGEGQKSKETMDEGIRKFFETSAAGIIEIKGVFFPVWREENKFYFVDPFACDEEGFRVDPEEVEKYGKAAACITMNSSLDQLIETIVENTESKIKDPFVVHGLSVLYVKSATSKSGEDEKVVFREKKTNRRPEGPPCAAPPPKDDCAVVVDPVPKPKFGVELPVDEKSQYPELMDRIDAFFDTFDDAKSNDEDDASKGAAVGYKIVNHRSLILKATKNCLSGDFRAQNRGKQGLAIAIVTMAESMKSDVAGWSGSDLDRIVTEGDSVYERIASWILRGSPGDFLEEDAQSRKDVENLSRKSKSVVFQGLDFLDIAMLPEKIRIGDDTWKINGQARICEGEANPLANLGEALERYFEVTSDELVLENSQMMYAIWKNDKNFFAFNAYGSDNCGWRNVDAPAAFFVTDTIVELVNHLYGLLEFNDHYFVLHFMKLAVISPDEQVESARRDVQRFERYKTKFLPVTNEDLASLKPEEEREEDSTLDGEEDADKEVTDLMAPSSKKASERQVVNIFCATVKEADQPNAPVRLNLALVTGLVKIRGCEQEQREKNLQVCYERLKYKHLPPFVAPPQKNVCDLLAVKLASGSAHSLLSRFSIDSRLPVKEKTDLPPAEHEGITVGVLDASDESKLISLPPKKYFFSQNLPSGLTPIRAIDETFIRDKQAEQEQEQECRRRKELENASTASKVVADPDKPILPTIIPLGPCISTPEFKRKPRACPDNRERSCPLSCQERDDAILKKLVCSTENLFLEMVLPDFKCIEAKEQPEEASARESSDGDDEESRPRSSSQGSESCGFEATEREDVGIIAASSSLQGREIIEEDHHKRCYFSAILCILAKINASVHDFRGSYVDQFVAAANKIGSGTTKLRCRMTRWLRDINVLGVRCNVIVRQVRYADPQSYKPDALQCALTGFLRQHHTGILVLRNASHAFWTASGLYFLFDPYPCDENGRAAAAGNACLLKFCSLDAFLERILENAGESAGRPYRLYTISISHLEEEEKKSKRKAKKQKRKTCNEERAELIEETAEIYEEAKLQSEQSLVELAHWICHDKVDYASSAKTCVPGFLPIKNYSASVLEVEILENSVTRQILAPLNPESAAKPERQTIYDRNFYEDTILGEPMDLCIMAWSQIYEPSLWSNRTLKALFEACREYTLDSMLASEDTSVPKMTDDLLAEFNVANYTFRLVFAPMHCGVLFATEGWNLAMSLDKIFKSPVYTGAVMVCGSAHFGLMKKGYRMYAWWFVKYTKKIRVVVSEDMRDLLKLIVKEINEPGEIEFSMRIVTISYAKMVGPNCSDIDGLHEFMLPSTSIAEIHRKKSEDYDLAAVFRPVDQSQRPSFVLGSVALEERDCATEPLAKRCYFVALFAVMLKRDIVQNPLPGMMDKVLQLAENLHKLLEQPKLHSEHILKDVSLMNRVFDLRDCASQLVPLQDEKDSIARNLALAVKKQLKAFFKRSSSGIIQFSNCCYAFWYSSATSRYYYLDPYRCDSRGRRASVCGSSCLCVFPTICQLAKQMCVNQFEETTGFYVHRVHVESVDSSPYDKFREDPIWTYLDYHWSHAHVPKPKKPRAKKPKEEQAAKESKKKPKWKSYLIEVPNMIYSVWGSVGSLDAKFGARACKNQAAIAVAVLALQNLCHPSEWSSAVLDSAVICGDEYYKDSRKSATKCLNRFNLPECLKVAPYLWSIEFAADVCGVLYGGSEQPTLADCLARAFARLPSLILQCKKKVVTMLKTSDAFYAVDSSWTGPPLFVRGRGAIYSIRCKNLNTLVYVLTKMLNTNQRLEFSITPVKMRFRQETCQSSDAKPKIERKALLDKPVYPAPGRALDCPCLVDGNVAVAEEDSYLCYSRNLKLGSARGKEYETAAANAKKSAKKGGSGVSPNLRQSNESCQVLQGLRAEIKGMSCTLERNVEYPRVFNFVDVTDGGSELGQCPRRRPCAAEEISVANYCRTKAYKFHQTEQNSLNAKQLDVRGSFVREETREVFDKYNEEMKKEVYRNRKHVSQESSTEVENIPPEEDDPACAEHEAEENEAES